MAAPLGNQNAKKAKRWQDALARALARKADVGGGVDGGLDKIADKTVAAAESGERWAIEEIGNRFDGKPAQAHTIAGDDEGGPIKIEKVERALVRANPED